MAKYRKGTRRAFSVTLGLLGLLVLVAGMAAAAASASAVTARPTVANVAPNAGPVAGGNQVGIAGTEFTAGSRVTFGGVRANSVDVISTTRIIAVAPKHSLGRTDVRVTTAGGTSTVIADQARYTYIAPPRALHVTDARKVDPAGMFGLFSVSCPTASFCAAFDNAGNVVMRIHGHWQAPVLITSEALPIREVSCPNASFCMATDSSGNTYEWNGTAWHDGPAISTSDTVDTWPISCPTTRFCMAVDIGGITHSAGVTTFNGTSWTMPTQPNPAIPVDFEGVSCPTAMFCDVDGGAHGETIVVPWRNGQWRAEEVFVTEPPLSNISCPTVHFCTFGDDAGVRVWTGDRTAWSPDIALHTPQGADAPIREVDCTNATFCMAYWQDLEHKHHWARFDGASVAVQHFTPVDVGSFPRTVSCSARYTCSFVGGWDAYQTS